MERETPLCETVLSLFPLVKDIPKDVPLSIMNCLPPGIWQVSAKQALPIRDIAFYPRVGQGD